MPLLRREPEIFPEDLFTQAAPWLVAHVRSRREKVLARHLHANAIPYYVPQIEQQKLRAGRRFTSFLPLFPGYVFVRIGSEGRDIVWRSNVVVRFITVPDQTQLGGHLSEIRKLQIAGASLQPFEEYVPGDPVIVREGAFKGYQGIVLREKGRERLLISIALLKKSVAVEFDREHVHRASERGKPPVRRAG